jgi:hypothetical protein
MNELKTVDSGTSVSIRSETAAIMDMIEQIALNPNADVEKLRAVMDMKMMMFNRGAEIEFNAAMAKVQQEIEPVARESHNSQTKSTYAKLESIIQACSPVWTAHGFALSFGSGDSTKPGYYRITCTCSHTAGHSVEYFADLPEDVAGIAGTTNKTKIHGFGSTMSYGRRYLTCLIFNIALVNEDNDGNKRQPANNPPKTPTKPTITDAGLDATIIKIKAGEMTAEHLLKNRALTPGQRKKLDAEVQQ